MSISKNVDVDVFFLSSCSGLETSKHINVFVCVCVCACGYWMCICM